MLLGVHLTLLIGPTIPAPAPVTITEALRSVQVTQQDEGRNGFQLTFELGRDGPTDLLDFPLLLNPLLGLFSRVILIATVDALPTVLMDGFVTHRATAPGTGPGTGTLTLTGEDVSLMMDMTQRRASYPAQDESLIALQIIASYALYGLIPAITPPPSLDVPLPIERVPVQQDTDLKYLKDIAARFGYVFYVAPGPVPLTNTAYWGPPQRIGVPQPALSVNMGAQTNVDTISFQYNGLAPQTVSDIVHDKESGLTLPVITFASTRVPLVPKPAILLNQPNVRTSLVPSAGGLSFIQAYARAQGQTDSSTDQVVTASGSLDMVRYGSVLQPRGLVGLRGAGFAHDGLFYVKSVTHQITHGQYKQNFTLTREGDGSITPVVLP